MSEVEWPDDVVGMKGGNYGHHGAGLASVSSEPRGKLKVSLTTTKDSTTGKPPYTAGAGFGRTRATSSTAPSAGSRTRYGP